MSKTCLRKNSHQIDEEGIPDNEASFEEVFSKPDFFRRAFEGKPRKKNNVLLDQSVRI